MCACLCAIAGEHMFMCERLYVSFLFFVLFIGFWFVFFLFICLFFWRGEGEVLFG